MIITLISDDGKVDEAERSFVKKLMQQYQIPKENKDDINKYLPLEGLIAVAKHLLDRKKSLYLIKEMLAVANTDGDFNDKEIDLIIKVTEALGIEPKKLVEINQVVIDDRALQERYKMVMEIED